MNWRNAHRLLAVTIMLVFASFAAGGVARPQQSLGSAQIRTPQLQVLTLDTVLQGPDDEVRIELAVRNPAGSPAEALRVTATLYRRAVSRFDFQRAVEQGRVGGVVARLEPADVGPVPAGATRAAELTASAQRLGVDEPALQGVYPLRIALERDDQAGGRVIDEVMTSVVVVSPEVASPLRLAFLVPVDHPPGLLADGRYQPRFPQAFEPGAPLERLTRELETAGRLPLTVAPSGYLLEQASGLQDQPAARQAVLFLQRLRNVSSRPDVEQVALPYGPADLVALVRVGLEEQARRALGEGARAVSILTGQRVRDDVLVPPDGLDPGTLQAMRGQGVRTIVLDERWLDVDHSRQRSVTPTPVRRLRTGETVLVPDPFIGQLLSRRFPSNGVVEAQRVLAETAAVYFERPFATAPRGLLVATPGYPNLPEGLLSGLLTGIGSAPWLQPVGLSTLQDALEPDPRPLRLAYPRENRRRELEPAYLTGLAQADRAISSLAAVLPTPDAVVMESPAVVKGFEALRGTPATPPTTVERLNRLLLTAAAVWYRDSLFQPEGAGRIAAIHRAVDQIYSSVRIEEQPVTLTSIEQQQLPVTITNLANVPLRVRVRLEAQPVALERGNVQLAVLRPGTSTTLTFAARVLTPGGTFAANVVVEDPDGARELARGSVQVRSAAYSIVALMLTAGAAVFLFAWWVREIVRRRNQPASQSVPATPAPPE